MTAIVGYVVLALVAIVMALVARDVAVRVLADRADSRVKRASEAEAAAARMLADSTETSKRLRELETKVAHAIGARVRR